MCRKVRDRPSVSNSPLKEEVEIAIIGLAGDEMDEEGTEEWTNKVDRGGLWHVNDDVYSLFLLMEFEAKDIFKMTKEGVGKRLSEAIRESSDVQLKWWLLSSDTDDQVGSLILNNMIDLYVTIRGFAFASGCIELFKQSQKASLQKKTALRKELS